MVWRSRQRTRHRFNIYVSTIKIDANGLCASQAQYIWRHHVKMQINKNTMQLAMLRNMKDMGE